MAAQLLVAADWAAIDTAVRHTDDPLLRPDPEPRYALIVRHLTEGAQA
jgi:hypothetical protein